MRRIKDALSTEENTEFVSCNFLTLHVQSISQYEKELSCQKHNTYKAPAYLLMHKHCQSVELSTVHARLNVTQERVTYTTNLKRNGELIHFFDP